MSYIVSITPVDSPFNLIGQWTITEDGVDFIYEMLDNDKAIEKGFVCTAEEDRVI